MADLDDGDVPARPPAGASAEVPATAGARADVHAAVRAGAGVRATPGASAERPAAVGVVGLIGVGRAGTAVGAALSAAGHDVAVVHVRSTSSALRAAHAFPGAVVESPAGVAALSDLVVLGVPDDALTPVTAEIAAAGATRPGQVFVHLAGRHGLAVLEPVRTAGAAGAAIHPIMTLAGTERDVALLRGASFGVTADPGAEPVARAVVAAAGGRYVPVPEKGRAAYHASLALAANYLATLVAAGGDLMAQAGVDDPVAALGPLLRATLEGALAEGPAAMTGPIRRGDAGTVSAHLAALAASSLPPAAVEAYSSLGLLTTDYLQGSGTVRRGALTGVVALLDAWAHGRDRA